MLQTAERIPEEAQPAAGALNLWVDRRGILGLGETRENVETASAVGNNTQLASTLNELPDVGASLNSLALILPTRLTSEDRNVAQRCAALVKQSPTCRVCVVTSFRAHFADTDALSTEAFVKSQFSSVDPRLLTILRTGHVLLECPRLGPWHPLVSSRFRSCFLEVDELVQAIQQVLAKEKSPRQRTLTLLGQNRLLRDELAKPQQTDKLTGLKTALAMLLNLLMVGWLVGFVYRAIARFRPSWRVWLCDTLEPQSVSELLSLYNPLNYQHVALAGHNTGVVHFGWKFPGKTVVKTVGTGNRLRVDDATLQVDAGILLKQSIAALRAAERELYVVPNYSYISMGTIFFVPVHGSGSEVSVLGDTVESALLYDPLGDQFLRVKRGDSLFGKFMYNPQSQALVLRLKLRVRPKSRYFVRKEIRQNPSAAEVWQVFLDREASNIELRKSKAADEAVEISKYYTSSDEQDEVLEVPKDSIGKLWDRLEENPITSYLFHEMVKRLGFHVELFLNEDEFPIFWDAHRSLPLSKIQLRYVFADGLPHSPVGERDCISADIFMKRSESAEFLAFMKERLPDAKYNPGKHSM